MISSRKIILVEDNLNDVELTMEAFSAHNLEDRLVVLNDGVEAIEYLKSQENETEPPVVMLLDIKMPRMDGIEVLQVIKKDEKLKTIPIVMLTSSREDPDLKTCYELGANAYVVKPVKFKNFVEVVESLGVFWGKLNEPPLPK